MRHNISHFIDTAFHRWWFLFLLLLPQFLPPYASHGYTWTEWPAVNQFVITQPVKSGVEVLFPIFKVIPLLFLTVTLITRQLIPRLFYGYAALVFALVAGLQSISVSERWGIAICTGNLITFMFLSVLWIKEAIRGKHNIPLQKLTSGNIWPLLLAFPAFWFPVHPSTFLPDFNPVYLFTSGAGLSFCLSTPFFLSVLMLTFPNINSVLLACTAFIGLYMGVSNLALEWVIIPQFWWIGVLHVPLVIISAYCLVRVLFVGMDQSR
jgi:hypothetical protein